MVKVYLVDCGLDNGEHLYIKGVSSKRLKVFKYSSYKRKHCYNSYQAKTLAGSCHSSFFMHTSGAIGPTKFAMAKGICDIRIQLSKYAPERGVTI